MVKPFLTCKFTFSSVVGCLKRRVEQNRSRAATVGEEINIVRGLSLEESCLTEVRDVFSALLSLHMTSDKELFETLEKCDVSHQKLVASGQSCTGIIEIIYVITITANCCNK